MKHSDFSIGTEFDCGPGRWRCTDVGTRTVVAIRIDAVRRVTKGETLTEDTLDGQRAEADGWFRGPPYAVAETVFDEDDFETCDPATGA